MLILKLIENISFLRFKLIINIGINIKLELPKYFLYLRFYITPDNCSLTINTVPCFYYLISHINHISFFLFCSFDSFIFMIASNEKESETYTSFYITEFQNISEC